MHLCFHRHLMFSAVALRITRAAEITCSWSGISEIYLWSFHYNNHNPAHWRSSVWRVIELQINQRSGDKHFLFFSSFGEERDSPGHWVTVLRCLHPQLSEQTLITDRTFVSSSQRTTKILLDLLRSSRLYRAPTTTHTAPPHQHFWYGNTISWWCWN